MIVLETSRHVQDTPLGVWISREPFQIFNGFGYDKQPPPPRTLAGCIIPSFFLQVVLSQCFGGCRLW